MVCLGVHSAYRPLGRGKGHPIDTPTSTQAHSTHHARSQLRRAPFSLEAVASSVHTESKHAHGEKRLLVERRAPHFD